MDGEKIDISYETLWKAVIRPPRDDYDDESLGEAVFTYRGKTYIRHDYQILNKRGHLLKLSFLENDIDSRESYIMPLVIYLHGNSSSRLEGLKSAPELLKKGINVGMFDFSGCGQSEGDYISLGWFERDDVRIVIDFFQKLPGVGNIGLWGRSMGAATTMLYSYSDNRIKAICMDSPFGDFKLLATELCLKHVTLPNFVIDGAMGLVKNTIKEKSGLEIDKLQPQLYASKTKIPAFFVHAVNDELINLEQTIQLYEKYNGEKSLNVVEGGHNSTRQKHVLEKIAKFFATYLFKNDDKKISNRILINDNMTKNEDFLKDTDEKKI
jgi:pimeloyl-ACP methyl ester carboxylesterase